MKIGALIAAIAFVLIFPTQSFAKRHHHNYHYQNNSQVQSSISWNNFNWQPQQSKKVYRKKISQKKISHHHHRTKSHVYGVVSYLPHPDGCPRRAFCGCGAGRDLGLRDRSLWLARSWYKFPRAVPAPNTVAVAPHHVFVLKQHVDGNIWLVADYNSGGHASRLHYRSISGYTIVRPI